MRMRPESPAPDEAADLAALRRGHDGALARLMVRWERPLLAFAWRYLHDREDARDLVIETFVRLHQQRERLRPDTRLAPWLFTTLANLCHNQQRWRRRHPTTSLGCPAGADDPAGEATFQSDSPDTREALEHDEVLAALTAAVDRLPHDLKVTLLLHYVEGLAHRETAAIVGCTARGVETRLYRARHQLRRELSALRQLVS